MYTYKYIVVSLSNSLLYDVLMDIESLEPKLETYTIYKYINIQMD